jgi:hypothetical protein
MKWVLLEALYWIFYQDCVEYSYYLNAVYVKFSSLNFIEIIFKNLLPTSQKTFLYITFFYGMLRWVVHANCHYASNIKKNRTQWQNRRIIRNSPIIHYVLQEQARWKKQERLMREHKINSNYWSCVVKCRNASRRTAILYRPHIASYK